MTGRGSGSGSRLSPEALGGVLSSALSYAARRDYAGYSLYDSHSGRVPFASLGPRVSFYANQVVKRSPVNLRPLLGVPRERNPKGVGLFLLALAELARADAEPPGVEWAHDSLEAEARELFRWLRDNPSPGYGGHAWGYNFDWPKRDGSMVPAFTPSSVVTGFNARAVHAYWRHTGDPGAAEVLQEAARFVSRELPVTETGEGLCYAYTPLKRDLTVNANLLAGEVLAYADDVAEQESYADEIRAILRFTRARQEDDGSWAYSFDPDTGAPRRQIDFHQGYVLESVRRILAAVDPDPDLDLDRDEYRSMLLRGLRFYLDRQFDSRGRAVWRHPRRWPVDVHNQSQGIITFTLFRDLFPEGFERVPRIVGYTLDELWSEEEGCFYYQKWPGLVNRTVYMRWNQAWMVVALTQLLVSVIRESA